MKDVNLSYQGTLKCEK